MKDTKVLTKEEIANEVARLCHETKGDATKIVDCVFTLIAQGLLDDEVESVKIAGFGTFSVSVREARTGINPLDPTHTQTIEIPETKTVKFKSSKTLKDLLNDK